AYPGFWLKDPATGVDWKKVLHGEQGLKIHEPLPASGTVVGVTRIDELIDKGAGKGALLYSTRESREKSSGKLLAEVSGCGFLRGDGGFGGPAAASPKPHPAPERAPDLSTAIPRSRDNALVS